MSALPVGATHDSIFAQIDTDKNGRIEKGELLAYLLSYRVEPDEVRTRARARTHTRTHTHTGCTHEHRELRAALTHESTRAPLRTKASCSSAR